MGPPRRRPRKTVVARFHELAGGGEPVREWLRELAGEDRRSIGRDSTKVEFGWPCGPPLCARVGGYPGMYEVRSRLTNRIARVFFTVSGRNMAPLHGIVKKSRRTPKKDLELAARHMKEHD